MTPAGKPAGQEVSQSGGPRVNGVEAAGGKRVRLPHRTRSGRRPVFAALDLGTNSCRLLIARFDGAGFHVIDGFSRIVRLGEGTDETGVLAQAAIARTVDALKLCAAKIRRHHADRVRCVATEACRQASNADSFLARVEAETGLHLEMISSREEAELTLAGCLPLLARDKSRALLFDVGGGSTELVWLAPRPEGESQIIALTSLPCGVVSLTERNGSSEFSPHAFEAMVEEICAMLLPFEAAHGIRQCMLDGSAQLLGTASTVTTLCGVSMGLARYDRSRVDGAVIALAALRAVGRQLAAASYAERAAYPSIGRGRADLMVAGCAVLEAVCRIWPAAEIRVADRGVREGILARMAAAHQGGDAAHR